MADGIEQEDGRDRQVAGRYLPNLGLLNRDQLTQATAVVHVLKAYLLQVAIRLTRAVATAAVDNNFLIFVYIVETSVNGIQWEVNRGSQMLLVIFLWRAHINKQRTLLNHLPCDFRTVHCIGGKGNNRE